MIFFYFISLTHLYLLFTHHRVYQKGEKKKEINKTKNNERPLIILYSIYLWVLGLWRSLKYSFFFPHFIILLLQTDNITCANFKTKAQLKHRFQDHNAAALASCVQIQHLILSTMLKVNPPKCSVYRLNNIETRNLTKIFNS